MNLLLLLLSKVLEQDQDLIMDGYMEFSLRLDIMETRHRVMVIDVFDHKYVPEMEQKGMEAC